MKKYSIYNFPHHITKEGKLTFDDFYLEFNKSDLRYARYLRNKDNINFKESKKNITKRKLIWYKTCTLCLKKKIPSKLYANTDHDVSFDICTILSFLSGGSVATENLIEGTMPERFSRSTRLNAKTLHTRLNTIYSKIHLLRRTSLNEVFTNFILANEQIQYLAESVFLHASFNKLYESIWIEPPKMENINEINRYKKIILDDLEKHFKSSFNKYNISSEYIGKFKLQLKYADNIPNPSAKDKIIYFLKRIEILNDESLKDEGVMRRIKLISEVRNVNFHEGSTDIKSINDDDRSLTLNIVVLELISSMIYYYFLKYVFKFPESSHLFEWDLISEFIFEGTFQGVDIFSDDISMFEENSNS